MVDVPQLELALCGDRDDVGRVEEIDVGYGFPVSLEVHVEGVFGVWEVVVVHAVVGGPEGSSWRG